MEIYNIVKQPIKNETKMEGKRVANIYKKTFSGIRKIKTIYTGTLDLIGRYTTGWIDEGKIHLFGIRNGYTMIEDQILLGN